MCGRFTQAQIAELDREIFKLLEVPNLEPRYNLAPTEPAAAVREHADGGRSLDLLRWGLIPSWADNPSIGNRLINARAESVHTKPAFREAFVARRCLVPADGFYEWRHTGSGKQPYYIYPLGGGVMAFAGLWEHYAAAAQGPIESFTIITTDANDLVRPIHDRMPVVLPVEAYDEWLDPTRTDIRALRQFLQPYPSAGLELYPVSRYVNSPHHKGAECVEPVTV